MRRVLASLAVCAGLASPALAASPAPVVEEAGGYVGSKACEGCHTYIYERWRTTRHSQRQSACVLGRGPLLLR